MLSVVQGTLVQGGSGVLSEQRVGLGVIHGIPSASGDMEAGGGGGSPKRIVWPLDRVLPRCQPARLQIRAL